MIRTFPAWLPGQPLPRVWGAFTIPASKSHSIRALLIAALAEGESRLRRPLKSLDTLSCSAAVKALGARVEEEGEDWVVEGVGSRPRAQGKTIDVGNSGTTLYLCTALAALSEETVYFDGDEQIRRRSARPLLEALSCLGASVKASGEGCAPYAVRGPLHQNSLKIDCPVSQYLSALLLVSPLIPSKGEGLSSCTEIQVSSLNEASYVGITLDWLDRQGLRYRREGWKKFSIPGDQRYHNFDTRMPADWSSAVFFLVAAAITEGKLFLRGLDFYDSQGDKAVLGMLEKMGCRYQILEGGIEIQGAPLRGLTLDLNDTPDALPALAVCACFAQGETRLINVPQARLKETDRLAVMAQELRKMGVDITELPDGLRIQGRASLTDDCFLQGAELEGHGDHRIVMALAIAALRCRGSVSIRDAQAVDVTFPGFFESLEKILHGEG